jgi:hypothetical protein
LSAIAFRLFGGQQRGHVIAAQGRDVIGRLMTRQRSDGMAAALRRWRRPVSTGQARIGQGFALLVNNVKAGTLVISKRSWMIKVTGVYDNSLRPVLPTNINSRI